MKKITYQTGDTHLADCYGDIYPIPGTKGVCILKIDGGSAIVLNNEITAIEEIDDESANAIYSMERIKEIYNDPANYYKDPLTGETFLRNSLIALDVAVVLENFKEFPEKLAKRRKDMERKVKAATEAEETKCGRRRNQ